MPSLFSLVLGLCLFTVPGFPQEGTGSTSRPASQNPGEKGTTGEKKPLPVGPSPAGQVGDGGEVVPPSTNKGKPIPPGCWFRPIHLDFGHVVENSREFVEGTFHFENPTDAEQKILDIVPSCKCQHLELIVNGKEVKIERDNELKLKAPIPIPARAKGELRLRLNVTGGPQHRTGDIRIETSDAGMPAFILTAEAIIDPIFEIVPKIVDLGRMDPMDRREWTVKVRHRFKKDWKIVKVNENIPQSMAVLSMTPEKTDKGTVYTIKGVYGPGIPEGSVGGFLLFHTDDPNENIQLQVDAEVRQRVNIDRSFWSYGRFERSKGAKHTVHLWPAEGTKGFTVRRVEPIYALNPKEYCEIEILPPAMPGSGVAPVALPGLEKKIPADRLWRIEVRIKPGVPGRVVRMKLKIHFAEKDLLPKIVHFNGFPYGN